MTQIVPMTTVLLTGGAGFSGSHIADEIVATADWNVVVIDPLTYAGRLDRLAHLPGDLVRGLPRLSRAVEQQCFLVALHPRH